MKVGMDDWRWTLNRALFFLIIFWNCTRTISFCPPLCSCDDSTLLVDCHEARNLKMVPIFLNPQTKFLSLARNQISEISMSLQFYSELQLLDFSQNQIESLGSNNFENLKNCKVLNASYNSIKELESDVFLGLKQTVVLDLSVNQIESIGIKSFRGLISLKELYLDRNRLDSLDWDLLVDLVSLEKLSVRFNFIRVLEPPLSLGPALQLIISSNLSSGENEKVLASTSSFWNLRNLMELDVSWNQLTRVKDYGLSVLPALQDLSLCCNYIHTIEERAFSPFPSSDGSSGSSSSSGSIVPGGFSPGHSLTKVNLSQNRLGRIPTESLEKLGSSLHNLDLSSNRISDEVESNSFRSLFQLETLNLSENPGITSIDSNALLDNIHLVSFEANHLSNLTSLPVGLFNNKPYLQYLSLQFAQISTVPEELFTNPVYSPLLASLDLVGNPIDCNCSAYPLFQYIAQLGAEDERLGSQSQSQDSHSSSPIYLKQEANKNNSQASSSTQPYQSSSSVPTVHKQSLRKLVCVSPPRLNQIQLKDLSSTDFQDCFDHYTFSNEYFEILVISLASFIILCILVVIGVKLCCVYQVCAKCREEDRIRRKQQDSVNNCSNLDEFCSNVGGMSRKSIIVGNNGSSGPYNGTTIPLPLSPALSTKSKKKSGLGNYTETGSPHHRFPLAGAPVSSNGGTLSSRYSNGTSSTSHHRSPNPNFLPRVPLPNDSALDDYDDYHQYTTISNRHPLPSNYSNNKLRFDPKMQLVLGNKDSVARGHSQAPPPMILHYEYDYPDYRNTHHRVKQVPSVLV